MTDFKARREKIDKSNRIELYLLRKYIFAALFALILFCFSGVNIYQNWEKIAVSVAGAVRYYDTLDRQGKNEFVFWASQGSRIVDKCNEEINEDLIFVKELLWINGRYEKLQGQIETPLLRPSIMLKLRRE